MASSGLHAQQKTVKLGITLPLTGADADDAAKIKNGSMIAIDEANAKGGVARLQDRTVVCRQRHGDGRPI